MDPRLNARIERRALAKRRLADVTGATAVAGLAATVGFGWLASMTYAGTPAVSPATDPATVAAPTTPSDDDPGVTTGPTPTATPRSVSGGSSSSGSSSSGVSRSRGSGHVSTGSS